jgi:hypothetical protein
MKVDELCGIKQAYITTIHSIRQIKVYMINHTKIYVEHEGRVNLLFQLPEQRNKKNFPTLDGKIGGCVFVSLLLMVNGYYIQRKPCRHNR